MYWAVLRLILQYINLYWAERDQIKCKTVNYDNNYNILLCHIHDKNCIYFVVCIKLLILINNNYYSWN